MITDETVLLATMNKSKRFVSGGPSWRAQIAWTDESYTDKVFFSANRKLDLIIQVKTCIPRMETFNIQLSHWDRTGIGVNCLGRSRESSRSWKLLKMAETFTYKNAEMLPR